MTNDDLFTQFRSDVPLPDDITTKQIYERATSGRRRPVTRRRLVAAVAVIAAAGIAGGVTATLGGGGSKFPAVAAAPDGKPGASRKLMLNPLTTEFTASGDEYTAIDTSLLSIYSDTTLEVRVVRSDASDVSGADNAPYEVVFDEQVPMTDGSNPEDTFTTWSGTLTPSEWTGGCQQGLYRIDYDFGTEDTAGSSGWFQCSGPLVDATNPFLY